MKRPKLRYFQCDDYKVLPIELVSQMEGDEWTVENYIKYQELMKSNPNYFLYALVDDGKDKKIVGFLCCVLDEVKKALFIRGLSVAKEYQDGSIIPFTKRFVEMIIRKSKGYLKNVYWTTMRPKGYLKYGLHESKYKIMSLIKED